MTIEEIKRTCQSKGIQFVLAQFVDIHGVAKSKAVPIAHLDGIFKEGAGFAGFAVDGLGTPPHGPDYMAVGDPSSFRLMPWMPGFARLACDGHIHGKPHKYDSRVIAKRALDQLRSETGYEMMTGLEPEFFLLRRDPETKKLLPAVEADTLKKPCYDFRSMSRASSFLTEFASGLIQSGIDVYQIDHEDANSQYEVNFTYSNALRTADDFILVKMAASEIAHRQGMICSFMPKPFSNRPGSGMHMHMSFAKNGQNAFMNEKDKNELGLSELAYHCLGGILAHAPALTAIAAPSVNSYKRLVGEGSMTGATWAPTSICYGNNNRTAMVRIPFGRIELRVPDTSANPYLLTAAVVGACLDGIKKKMDPGAPVNLNLYEMSGAEKKQRKIASLPDKLPEALVALERDEVMHGILGEELVKDFIQLKQREWTEYHRHVADWETERYLEFF